MKSAKQFLMWFVCIAFAIAQVINHLDASAYVAASFIILSMSD